MVPDYQWSKELFEGLQLAGVRP